MRTLWRFLVRTVFWDYERGTWPYDLMIIAIVLFVFLSPTRWFNDRPVAAGAGPGPHAAEVQLLGQESATRTATYRVDAHLLAPTKPDPQWERKAHDFLRKNVEALKQSDFQIVRVEAGRDSSGTVLYYDIAVKPQ